MMQCNFMMHLYDTIVRCNGKMIFIINLINCCFKIISNFLNESMNESTECFQNGISQNATLQCKVSLQRGRYFVATFGQTMPPFTCPVQAYCFLILDGLFFWIMFQCDADFPTQFKCRVFCTVLYIPVIGQIQIADWLKFSIILLRFQN